FDVFSGLMIPEQIVFCESESSETGVGFDAKCYEEIFAEEKPETHFVSVGSSSEVARDRKLLAHFLKEGPARVIRIIDRDDHIQAEVGAKAEEGIRVLGRRDLESYILDDEIVTKFVLRVGK